VVDFHQNISSQLVQGDRVVIFELKVDSAFELGFIAVIVEGLEIGVFEGLFCSNSLSGVDGQQFVQQVETVLVFVVNELLN